MLAQSGQKGSSPKSLLSLFLTRDDPSKKADSGKAEESPVGKQKATGVPKGPINMLVSDSAYIDPKVGALKTNFKPKHVPCTYMDPLSV